MAAGFLAAFKESDWRGRPLANRAAIVEPTFRDKT
jgi:hypothetical protein